MKEHVDSIAIQQKAMNQKFLCFMWNNVPCIQYTLASMESLTGSSLVLEVEHTERVFCMFSAH